MKGWLVSASPSAREVDSTPWYASFWEFCARYCSERFRDEWHLSPAQSLLIHGEKTVIPEQVVVYSPTGTNNNVKLLFGYIHPYPDGNGRIARFLMNIMLASGGYAWTVIRVEDRKEYLGALDSASIDMDIKPFSAFVAERTRWPLEHVKRS